jgi:hypothetical protein
MAKILLHHGGKVFNFPMLNSTVKRRYEMVISEMVKMSKKIKFVFIELILEKRVMVKL